jgi:hypothetical protein
LGPIPNPQSPIPNPHFEAILKKNNCLVHKKRNLFVLN